MRSKTAWDIAALVYDLLCSKTDRQLYAEVLNALEPAGSIDEFGCGTGNLTSMLPETALVRAIDCSPFAIEKAKKKANGNVSFFVMDFYRELPTDYKPEQIVACRCLYHKDLSYSLSIVSEHLSSKGKAIVAHPQEAWKKYITPIAKGSRCIGLAHLVKSSARLNTNYALFSASEFERTGRLHFDEVAVKPAAYDTHYLVELRKRT